MKNLIINLKFCSLFNNFSNDEILDITSNINYRLISYEKGEAIALEDTPINSIGIILDGSIEVQKYYSSGKTITINHIKKGGIFGEAIIFSKKNTYPSTIVSFQDSQIFFMLKEDIINLCSSNILFLNNFMQILSNRILTLNKALKDISFQTIREKLANFILNEHIKQNSIKIKLSYSRQELADRFGITRPSLSRELINMKNDGLINFEKKYITIINLDKLEDILLKS
ncbi:Crp/Fnr family transcriptional regulator [Clostridium botulinum]|uniref:cAMP-binding protein n=1 Tax=Clostridium botulinum C/D str. DC5 TaxID=1443128 RepID=A0A0A0IDC6_CLOBO|nr:Crp/Fnr family transcriptional regulator [Clostridium botulinum]KEI00361.1 cAMP-binding protein [Clostridium botulinum C/D str. BKT75002]KEI08982.1 cAMP-binding protein [Clostridium botulinum C/D str. BKT2873]KGM93670.1 cAMP-binding protein [Clostridium botulinum D str. CCUG 7971]KGM99454.1 cAMP-binding protein [Clostridium botulinum C/D str. DC5]KOC47804.1 cAMP-binding protein [Clostridium botulinum]